MHRRRRRHDEASLALPDIQQLASIPRIARPAPNRHVTQLVVSACCFLIFFCVQVAFPFSSVYHNVILTSQYTLHISILSDQYSLNVCRLIIVSNVHVLMTKNGAKPVWFGSLSVNGEQTDA